MAVTKFVGFALLSICLRASSFEFRAPDEATGLVVAN
jgi:hypothetical protein